MKTNKTNLFMILMMLAVGSASPMQAGKGCTKCEESHSQIKDTNSSFVKEMNDIEKCIHNIRHTAKDSYESDSSTQLDALADRITTLEKSTTEKNVVLHDHRIRTLRHRIETAREDVAKHAKKAAVQNNQDAEVLVQYKSSEKVSSENFLDRMHDIQSDLHTIRKEVKNCSVDCSMKKFDEVQDRINALDVDKSDDSQENLNMHDTHIRTLRRELKSGREYARNHGKKA